MRVPPDADRLWAASSPRVTELPGPGLVMMLDVEKRALEPPVTTTIDLQGHRRPIGGDAPMVYFADDSSVARKQIDADLDAGRALRRRRSMAARPGTERWRAMPTRRRVARSGSLPLVLTDVEMPEMDGYILTKRSRPTRASLGCR